MRLSQLATAAISALVAGCAAEQTFTIHGGQIFTPGFAVMNSPQPWTPMGGDTLHISIDVTANGKLPLLLSEDSASLINNVTLFLSSYRTGRNFTISNGTAGQDDASVGDIMSQEAGSTVKHVNWVWPDCLVGDGEPVDDDDDRGLYNISVRQNFRLNGTDHYTVFDLPIMVTNRIDADDARPECDALSNDLLTTEDIDAASANAVGILFAPDSSTEVDFEDATGKGPEENPDSPENGGGNGDEDEQDSDGDGADDPPLGGERPEAGPEEGLGGAGMVRVSWAVLGVVMMMMAVFI